LLILKSHRGYVKLAKGFFVFVNVYMEYLIYGLVFLVVIYLIRSVQIVPQGYEYTVQRFGRYTNTLKPGLNLIMPFVDAIGARINMMESVLEVPSQDVITKDNAVVTVDGVIFYQILDASKAAYEVSNLKIAILNLAMTNIRTVMGSMEMDELLSHREKINARLLEVIDEATNPWGTKVTRIEIKDIKPPRDLVDSMGRQMKAERDKRASILESEGMRQSEILRADGEKQALILEAEGKLEAARREAEARERLAQAEANATKTMAEAVKESGSVPLQYFIAERYVKAFGELAKANNQKVIMMPYEAANILSSIQGIKELLSEAETKTKK
jgi:regulator of protease activity HflC (stomatin/prohibitin superfamily)